MQLVKEMCISTPLGGRHPDLSEIDFLELPFALGRWTSLLARGRLNVLVTSAVGC